MAAALETLAEHSVEGVLVIAPEDEAVQGLRRFPVRVPTVAVEAADEAEVTTIGLDQVGAARSAVEHLLALGHTRIGHINGPRTRIEGRLRLRSWRQTLRNAGMSPPEPLQGDWSMHSGYAAGQRFLKDRDVTGVTAVFAASDAMAVGFMRALYEAGVRVPDDVSLVGFDDVPEAAYTTPALTTIRQDFGEIGRASLELLVTQMAAPDGPPTRHVVPTSLVVRESTAPRPRRATVL
jgi:DNA-binding LacI/PurR family transcriptional regulator